MFCKVNKRSHGDSLSVAAAPSLQSLACCLAQTLCGIGLSELSWTDDEPRVGALRLFDPQSGTYRYTGGAHRHIPPLVELDKVLPGTGLSIGLLVNFRNDGYQPISVSRRRLGTE